MTSDQILGRPTCCSSCRGTGISGGGQGDDGDQVCRACSGYGRRFVLHMRCERCDDGARETCELCDERARLALARSRSPVLEAAEVEPAPSYAPRCEHATQGCTGPLGAGLICLQCFAAISGTAAA